jgi:hypothetical protein
MKGTLLSILMLFFINGFSQGKAEFSFEKEVVKLGKVKEGEILNFEYPFTNTGTEPLLITEIKVACTCTKFDYPKNPIAPGEKSSIKVSFDTHNKIGYQDRTLEIFYNSKKSPKIIRFKVDVDNKK